MGSLKTAPVKHKTPARETVLYSLSLVRSFAGWLVFLCMRPYSFLDTPIIPHFVLSGWIFYILLKERSNFPLPVLPSKMESIFSLMGRVLSSENSLLVVTGWSLDERLEGSWLVHGGNNETHWRASGTQLAKKPAIGHMGSLREKLFHEVFHGKGRNVSERSLIFLRGIHATACGAMPRKRLVVYFMTPRGLRGKLFEHAALGFDGEQAGDQSAQ